MKANSIFKKGFINAVFWLTFFWPNMAVKGTRRTQALLKVGFYFGFVGFAQARRAARPLP
jgi:hypothetical protein